MNEVYAVDPAAPADWKELKLLLDQFGLQTGRFVADFPLDWIDEVRAGFARATEIERKCAIEVLKRRRCGLTTRSGAKFLSSMPWVENAVAATREFKCIIGCRQNGIGLPTVEDVLYDDEKALPSGIEDHLDGRADEYARVARPLFEASAEVILVDPFFLRADEDRAAQRKRTVLAKLLRCAESSGTCERFLLMLELPPHGTMSRSAAEAKVDDHIRWACREAGSQHVKVKRALREDVGHGRYLFSVDGGLHFDEGFGELRDGKKNHVTWLSQPGLAPLLKRFASHGGRTVMCSASVRAES